jgi:hypothetical protein
VANDHLEVGDEILDGSDENLGKAVPKLLSRRRGRTKWGAGISVRPMSAESKSPSQVVASITCDLLTKAQLANELQCSPRQIERLQRCRRIPVVKVTNRMVRYSRARVLAALSKVEVEAVA